jgi:branched-chain amino acid transport system ATP-binding protein
MAEQVLSISRLSVAFGGVYALSNVAMHVRENEIRAIIGPNGAGKSTFINAVTGALPHATGVVRFADEDISQLSIRDIARRGLVRTFQNNSPFPQFTIRENFWIAGRAHRGIGAGLLSRTDRRGLDAEVDELLRLTGLISRADQQVLALSHGDQRLVEIGLAFALKPRLLLLDEPTAGMSQAETDRTIALLQDSRERCAILLVEHDMAIVLNLADAITVLDRGRVIADGAPEQITRDPLVRDAYLGDLQ